MSGASIRRVSTAVAGWGGGPIKRGHEYVVPAGAFSATIQLLIYGSRDDVVMLETGNLEVFFQTEVGGEVTMVQSVDLCWKVSFFVIPVTS